MYDLHSHILPGIDDGADNEAESLAILEALANLGFEHIVLTPHYIVETKQSSARAKNLQIFEQLQRDAVANDLTVELRLGNEIYVDMSIFNLLEQDKISKLADSNYLLIELPMLGEFEGYEDIFLMLQQLGYQVILAHPERYHAMHEDYNILRNLHEQGILFQCNIGSIAGQYGRKTKKTIKKLLKDNYVYCFGTDIHRISQLEHHKKGLKKLQKLLDAEKFHELLVENPYKIVK